MAESIDTEQSSTPTIQVANAGQESVSTPPAKTRRNKETQKCIKINRELLDEKVTV